MKKTKRRSLLFGLFALVVLVVIDQAAKYLATVYLKGSSDLVLIPGVLQLHYLENTGMAFGLLEGHLWLFYVLTPIVCVLIFRFFLRLPGTPRYSLLWWIFIFLMSGALGNYYDRIRNHYVVDFIYFSLINFPVFNIADIYVTCSVAALFLCVLLFYQEDELDTVFRIGK